MLQDTRWLAVILVPAVMATMGGWLDRVVLFYKQKLFNEMNELAPIKISAELQEKPAGYVDSTQWDFESVQRLLTLISASETARPVHKALRRMLQPSRRLMMSMKESKHRFPSIKPDNNEFYYDAYGSSAEHKLPAPPPVPEDEVVVVVNNPVEARLPSARISVKLLRDILQARAIAARQMPTTKNRPWFDLIKNQTFGSTKKYLPRKTITHKNPGNKSTASPNVTTVENTTVESTTAENTTGQNTTEEVTTEEVTTEEDTTPENTSAQNSTAQNSTAQNITDPNLVPG